MPATPSLPSVVLACVAASITACDSSDTGTAIDSDAPPASISTETDTVLLEARRLVIPASVADNVRRRDPREDGWRTETLSGLAKPLLHDFVHHLIAAPDADFTPLGDLLDAAFTCTALTPRETTVAFDQGGIVVRRGTEPGDESFSRTELAPVRKRMLQPFDGALELNERSKILTAEEIGAQGFRTAISVQVSGQVESRAVQTNSRWLADWTVLGEDAGLRLRSLTLEAYEEVRAPRTLFADLTHHVLGFPGYERDFVRGAGQYQHRVDQLMGNAFWGHQGVSVGDVNGDGLEDVYVCQQSGLPNRLLLHQPDGTVVDDSLRSRTGFLENTASALILDMDRDGARDLVLAMGPLVIVAYNDGAGVFGDIVALRGSSPAAIYSLSAADPDGDGDLDVYACRHSNKDLLYEIPTPYVDANNGSQNTYFRNEGEREFTDATLELGFEENNTKFSYTSIWDDFDDDGDVDLYVVNDFGRNNLYRNEEGHFRDVAAEVGAEDINSGMGASVADFDRDGDVDIYVSNMFSTAGRRIVPQSEKFLGGENRDYHQYFALFARGNSLLVNNGDGTFVDATEVNGVAPGGWAWGARFVDFNNDGSEDIYSPCGFVTGKDTDDL